MPALTIPACGFSSGSKPTIESGIESSIAKGGKRRGWSDYDAIHETLPITFEQVTPLEVGVMRYEYFTNRLTGGMQIRVPWVVKDWALARNGGTAASSGDAVSRDASQAISGGLDPTATGFWQSNNTTGARQFSVAFASGFQIDELVLVTLRNAYTAPGVNKETDTFTLYGIQDFQFYNVIGGIGTLIPGCNVFGNNKIVRRFPVSLSTGYIFIAVDTSPDGYARIVALQANSYTYTADYIAEPDITPLPGSVNSRVTLRMRT